MFIYLNALKNLLRNKGRNILVSVILLIVLTATTISLAIRSASETMINDYQESFGVETRIITDWEYAEAHAEKVDTVNPDGSVSTTTSFEPEQIPLQKYLEFANSEYVKRTLFAASAQFVSDTLEPVPLDSSLQRVDGMTVEELMEMYNMSTLEELYEIWSEEDIKNITSSKRNIMGTIWGYSDTTLMRGFQEGRQKIIEGRFFENPGEVIIGKRFAELNDLSPGDIIYISGGKKADTEILPLTIAGVFTDYQAEANTSDVWIGVELSDIIVSFDTLLGSDFSGIYPIMDDIRFFLTNAEASEPFWQELKEKGLPASYKTDSNVEGYNEIVEPVRKMSSVAETFGIVILLTGAVILIFLSIINIRERKYEIGVLRAIGMKKYQLARGLVYESLSLILFCAVIGMALGGVLIKPISGMLLEGSEIAHAGVSLNPAILPLILLVAVGLGVISSLIGILYITKYEPMKILSEQN